MEVFMKRGRGAAVANRCLVGDDTCMGVGEECLNVVAEAIHIAQDLVLPECVQKRPFLKNESKSMLY
jgi:hypothetical protein